MLLGATFNFRRHDEEDVPCHFINYPENGLFRGPGLQARRPFRPAADRGERLFDLPVPFRPFRHQWLAWRRLTSMQASVRTNIPCQVIENWLYS